MFVRLEQQLHGLPADKSLRSQSRDSWWAVRIFLRLQSVKAAERLVDEGEGSWGCIEKERIIIAADKSIEGCKLRRSQKWRIPRSDVAVLRK